MENRIRKNLSGTKCDERKRHPSAKQIDAVSTETTSTNDPISFDGPHVSLCVHNLRMFLQDALTTRQNTHKSWQSDFISANREPACTRCSSNQISRLMRNVCHTHSFTSCSCSSKLRKWNGAHWSNSHHCSRPRR